MAVILRYNATLRGGLSIGGNTLGLSKFNNLLYPGDQDSIGGFITVSTTIPTAAGWATVVNLANNANITLDYNQNSSTGYIDIPDNSIVEYAELFWSGVVVNYNEVPPLSVWSTISLPITLIPPGGSSMGITATTVTAQSFQVGDVDNYVRSQEITSIVKQYGKGFYTVGKIPSAMSALDTFSNVAGWCILLAYSNPSNKYRDLTIYAMGDGVSVGTTITLPVSGFNTPTAGAVSARVLIAAAEGDANKGGDQVILEPSPGNQFILSGPNNKSDNFFGSQINNNQGLLDTTGTFGNRNALPFVFQDVFAGRQGWDVTNVDASTAFVNNQTNTTLILTTVNDGYNPTALGLQINSNEPVIDPAKTVDLGYAGIGERLTYTVTFKNIGNLPAYNAVFYDTVPNGTQFVPGSLIVNGAPSIENPANGIKIGSILQNAAFTILFNADITTLPSPNPIVNTGMLIYEFKPLPGSPTIVAAPLTNGAVTTVPVANLNLTKSVNLPYTSSGATLTYNINVKNNGTASATNVIFYDTIPTGTVFIPPALLNGSVISGNPQTGITIPSGLQAGQSATVTFNVSVPSIPSPNPILNFADTSYTFYTIQARSTSNVVSTTVNTADLSNSSKAVNKNYAICGDIITYTITLPNTGNATAINIVLYDTIPSGTSLVSNSVTVNGVQRTGADISLGVTIPDIGVGLASTVTFQVQVICGL